MSISTPPLQAVAVSRPVVGSTVGDDPTAWERQRRPIEGMLASEGARAFAQKRRPQIAEGDRPGPALPGRDAS
jgi:hypothetical protein